MLTLEKAVDDGFVQCRKAGTGCQGNNCEIVSESFEALDYLRTTQSMILTTHEWFSKEASTALYGIFYGA